MSATGSMRILVVCAVAMSFSPATVFGQPQETTTPTVTVTAPSANNAAYQTFKLQCEAATCGKNNGDVCVQAADILLGQDPPDHLRELSRTQRAKIALRLLEKGLDSSNLAKARAYDLYDESAMFGMIPHPDPIRAAEILDMMTANSYPGGLLRKARKTVGAFAIGTSQKEKEDACALGKSLLVKGTLDADSASIAREIVESSSCKTLEMQKG